MRKIKNKNSALIPMLSANNLTDHNSKFECCSARYESCQTDFFATSYKSALQIWLFLEDFVKSQTRTTAILLSCPDTIFHVTDTEFRSHTS